VIFGHAIASIAQSCDGVEVTFRNGDAHTFDLVIGADGLHSNVRRQIFGDESQYLRDLGMYLCVYSVPNFLHLDRMEVQYSEIGRVAAIWSTRDAVDAKACFGFAARNSRSICATALSRRRPYGRSMRTSGGRCLASSS
jgi:2-polyprenyl-6-methoxyphenol hydroxylase-like FAD-dependent oxidoreductase